MCDVVRDFKLVAIGDLHGDYDALYSALISSGLIDSNANWIGRNCNVVFMGDYLDSKRGRHSFPNFTDAEVYIVKWLLNIRHFAAEYNCTVDLLCGNHELMNFGMYDNLRDYANFEHRSDPYIFHISKPLGKYLSSTLAVITSRLGHLFVHGGLGLVSVKDLQNMGPNPERRLQFMDSLHKQKMKSGDFSAEAHPFLWSRNISDDTCPKELSTLLSLLGASRLVVGHTPQSRGISVACNKSVLRIDTQLSRAFAGPKKREILIVDEKGHHGLDIDSREIRHLDI